MADYSNMKYNDEKSHSDMPWNRL